MISITPKNGYNLADYPSGGSRMLGGCDLPDYRISMQNTQVLVVLRSRDQITLKGTYSFGVKVLLNLNGEKD